MLCNMVILDLMRWISTLNTPITGQVWRQIVASHTSCWSGEEGLHPIKGYHTWLVWSPGWVDMAAPYTTIRSRAPPPTTTTMMLMIHIYSYARARAGLLTSLRGAETPC